MLPYYLLKYISKMSKNDWNDCTSTEVVTIFFKIIDAVRVEYISTEMYFLVYTLQAGKKYGKKLFIHFENIDNYDWPHNNNINFERVIK